MRWILIGGIAIVLFDVVTALAARPLNFEYGSPPGLVITTAIYGVPPFFAARDVGTLRTGPLVGAAIALVDATFGWALSWMIGPGMPTDPLFRTPALVLLTVTAVAAIGAIIGLIAGFVALGIRRSRSEAP